MSSLVRHSLALSRRNLRKSLASPGQVLDTALMPVVLSVIFIYAFGGAIAGNSADYRQYLMPGIMALNHTIVSRTAGIALNTDFSSGVMDRYRSMPVARSAVLIGRVSADSVRLLISQLAVFAFALLIGFRADNGLLPTVAAFGLLLLYGIALCWVNAFIGLAARSIDTVQSVSTIAMLPLQFGSSVFVAPDTMPGWLRVFVEHNPMTLVVDASRNLMIGGPVAASAQGALLWIAGLIAVFLPLSVWRYRARV
ncbi:ABC transporter [Streptomyces platensis subsp. clarensis]|nr:ABC transporter [Streptomyces platensis subsp. clarensis]